MLSPSVTSPPSDRGRQLVELPTDGAPFAGVLVMISVFKHSRVKGIERMEAILFLCDGA